MCIYDFTCKLITFLCGIKIRIYRVSYADLQIALYFCGCDFTQHKYKNTCLWIVKYLEIMVHICGLSSVDYN